MACRFGLAGAVAAMALIVAPSAGAATKDVDIEATKFEPAVVVIPPGAMVRWTNRDGRPRALEGDFDSPSIAPGATFELRFRRLGVFAYRDRDNPLLTGTVIVAGMVRGRQPKLPAGPRIVRHRWKGSLRFDVRESWKYMDGKFLSFEGACNAQVGKGSRSVGFRAKIPKVVYARVGRLEVLKGVSVPYRIQRYRELIDSKTSDPGTGQNVDCGDGSQDPPPVVEQKCDHNYAGRRVRGELLWSPGVARGRFQWPHKQLTRAGLPRQPNCGHSFLHGHLVGLDAELLPWDPGFGSTLYYEHGRTSPTTRAETRAIREGRPVMITREFELRWTADCCLEWNEEGKPGTYVRAGARHVAFGKVTIRLRPRGP